MTHEQAAQLGEVLIAWSQGAVVEARSTSYPGLPWQPFIPGEQGWIDAFPQREWRVVSLPVPLPEGTRASTRGCLRNLWRRLRG